MCSILERNRKYRSNGTGNWSRNYSNRKSADVVPMETISPADLKDQAVWVLGCPAMGAEELEDGTVEPFVSELEGFASGKRLPCLDPMTGETANGCVHGLKEWNRLAHRSSAEKDLSATEHREQMQ